MFNHSSVTKRSNYEERRPPVVHFKPHTRGTGVPAHVLRKPHQQTPSCHQRWVSSVFIMGKMPVLRVLKHPPPLRILTGKLQGEEPLPVRHVAMSFLRNFQHLSDV